MKVLFLQNVLFDYRVPFYNGLVKRGFDVTVMHSGEPCKQQRLFNEIIVPVKKLGPFYFQSKRPNLEEFDAIVAMFDLHWPANVFRALSNRINRLVFWGHGLGKNKLGNYLRCFLANRADAMVLYTEVGRQAMLDYGLQYDKSYVANNTVEVENHEGKPAPGDTFLFVGRLQARKRIDLVMRAFSQTVSALPQKKLQLSIVGDGDIKSELMELAQELGISDSTTFHGAISDNALLKPIFHRALAYVSPGHLGLGLNHAMAFGVPILSNSSVTHAPEVAVLNSENSIMIDGTDDETCIAQLTEQMTSLVLDDDKAIRLSRQSYEDYVNHCSMERMIDGFEAAIRGTDSRDSSKELAEN